MLAGLAAPRPAIPARWLYDRRGSELFEAITRLPEYYLTRTEHALLDLISREVARLAGAGRALIEYGAGSAMKTRLLIEAVRPSAYVPIDISFEFLRDSVEELRSDFPDLPLFPLEADFMGPVALPAEVSKTPELAFFPGSTIGNLVAPSAVDLLRSMRETLGSGAFLLIGMDRTKDEKVLLRAYDDTAGVTAEFNLNLLHRINRELDGSIPVNGFRHRAIWNDRMSRIEMHLEAVEDVAFSIDGNAFALRAGETIHTENSHKYGARDARLLLTAGGWTVREEWTDPKDQFALILAEAEQPRFAP